MATATAETLRKVIDIIAGVKQFDAGVIQSCWSLSDAEQGVGMDSLDLVDIMLKLEDDFRIGLYDEDVDGCQIVQDLANLVQHELDLRG